MMILGPAKEVVRVSADERDEQAESPGYSESYRRYVIGLLLIVYVFNFIDRQILSILLESIKEELRASDTAMGFLTGIAFALFYTTAGIPLARFADRASRRGLIAAGLTVWSVMTALSGQVQNFVQLALTRVGVGVGEAACSPPAHSLISDYFPPERRATALAIYSLGIPIGSMIGFIAGGWIDQFFGWRMAFLVVGVPGIALALVVRLTLADPPRGHSDPRSVDRREVSLGDVLRYLVRLRSFLHLSFAASLHAFVGYGLGTWNASFLIRVHDMSRAEAGTWLGLIGGLAGGLGTFLGGWLSDRVARNDPRWYLWIPALSTLLSLPFAVAFYLWPDPRVGLMLAIPASVASAMYLGPTFALTQSLAKLRMRALAAAVLLFVINLVGLGLGPQAVGILSDLLHPQFGRESIRYALLLALTVNLWSAVHYAWGARTLRADLEAARAGAATGATGPS